MPLKWRLYIYTALVLLQLHYISIYEPLTRMNVEAIATLTQVKLGVPA